MTWPTQQGVFQAGDVSLQSGARIPSDNAAELLLPSHAALRPIPSVWGHRAGNPVVNPEDMLFIRNEARAWLAQ